MVIEDHQWLDKVLTTIIFWQPPGPNAEMILVICWNKEFWLPWNVALIARFVACYTQANLMQVENNFLSGGWYLNFIVSIVVFNQNQLPNLDGL